MAERRMFAKSIVLSDAFLDMPLSARCLYFHLGMVAKNKGIIDNIKAETRSANINYKFIQTLINNGYIKRVEENKFKITHWYENNGVGETAKKRLTYEYRKWREAVLKRDKKCVKCGNTTNLHVHHILPFAYYPDERLNLNNGITLCEKCHREYHRTHRRQ